MNKNLETSTNAEEIQYITAKHGFIFYIGIAHSLRHNSLLLSSETRLSHNKISNNHKTLSMVNVPIFTDSDNSTDFKFDLNTDHGMIFYYSNILSHLFASKTAKILKKI